jgi:hypothetical protein
VDIEECAAFADGIVFSGDIIATEVTVSVATGQHECHKPFILTSTLTIVFSKLYFSYLLRVTTPSLSVYIDFLLATIALFCVRRALVGRKNKNRVIEIIR